MRHLSGHRLHRDISRTVVARGWVGRDAQLLLKGYRVSVWEDEKVLKVEGDDGCTTVGMYRTLLNYTLKNG